MATFVLVHGAWHGAWCWQKLVPLLEAEGHRVVAPDLLGLGEDQTPLAQVTLDAWTEQICRVLDAESEPVILVGHSRGGLIISQVAERRPDKIAKVVYLTAMLVKNGEAGLPALGALGHTPLQDYMVPDTAGTSITVRDEGIKPSFYGMCSDDDLALARPLLRREPVEPSTTPVTVSERNFGRVPRVYIECRRDGAILPAMQKAMYTASPCGQIITMDTDHSPFFSAPAELARHLAGLA
ncbi:MAG: alpha/beta fold hydrolase [Stellaceae bacterium]